MVEQIFASFVSTLFGAILGIWIAYHALRATLRTHDIHLVRDRLVFTPHPPPLPEVYPERLESK